MVRSRPVRYDSMPQPELRRSLRTFDGVAFLIGITIGSGIYSTPSLVAGYFVSSASDIATWVAVGLFVMIGGLIYAELGTRLPHTGGEYAYTTRCFGPSVSELGSHVPRRESCAAGEVL